MLLLFVGIFFCHFTFFHILNHRQNTFLNMIGYVLQMRNKVLEFSSLESNKNLNNVDLFQSVVTWSPCIFQGIVNKWSALMWLGWAYRCPIRFQCTICSYGGEREFKKIISITWHSLVFLSCDYPSPLEEDVTLHFTIFDYPLP